MQTLGLTEIVRFFKGAQNLRNLCIPQKEVNCKIKTAIISLIIYVA